MSSPIRYRITPADPAAHLFEVRVHVADPDPTGQEFRIPAWIPGSYLIRDFARNVVAIAAESDGEAVGITKIDKSGWQTDACEGPLDVILEIHASELNVRGVHLDTTHAYFNGPCVFPAVVGRESDACELDVLPPPDGSGNSWRVATSMSPLTAERYGFGSYQAADYWELIDHPVEIGDLHIGEFEVAGIPHAIAVRGHTKFDMGRLCRDVSTLCAEHHELLGAPADLDRYLFLLLVKGDGYGGLEHRWSSSLICSRHELPRHDTTDVDEDFRRLLGLFSHEYFHLWNVTRMKPAAFTPYRLHSESHTGLLWVFEGITSYYDDLALVRSGLITPESYLELLGQTITRVLRAPGRHRQSIEESSFDAWTKLYKPDAGSPNLIISYYTKGAMVACALDLTLRHLSDGRCTLDDVMRECWVEFGESGEGMPERGLEAVARRVGDVDIDDFFERYVRGTADVPLDQLLQEYGVRLNLRPTSTVKDKGGKPAKPDEDPPPWLGVVLAVRSGRSFVKTVVAGSPAEQAGVSPGDRTVAIDDLELTAGNLRQRLNAYRANDTVTLTVFRDDRLMRVSATLALPPEDTCYLVMDEAASDTAIQRREAWLSN